MIHIYECSDGSTTYFEIYKTIIERGYNEEYIRTLENQNELDLYIDIIKAKGLDFVIHTLLEYEEYHLALEKECLS
jgi:ketol-acid reductoisomerase